MKKRYAVLSLYFLFAHLTANAMSYANDSLIISNHTDGDISIEVEWREEPQGKWGGGYIWMFNKKIGDLEVTIDIRATNNILASKNQMIYLTVMPKWALTKIDGHSPYEILHAIPMLDIVRSVIKSLVITNERGDLLFSLADAEEEDFTAVTSELVNEIDYFLDIW